MLRCSGGAPSRALLAQDNGNARPRQLVIANGIKNVKPTKEEKAARLKEKAWGPRKGKRWRGPGAVVMYQENLDPGIKYELSMMKKGRVYQQDQTNRRRKRWHNISRNAFMAPMPMDNGIDPNISPNRAKKIFKYEYVLIFNPNSTFQVRAKEVRNLCKTMFNAGAEKIAVRSTRLLDLAVCIHKHDQAYYVVISYDSPTETSEQALEFLRRPSLETSYNKLVLRSKLCRLEFGNTYLEGMFPDDEEPRYFTADQFAELAEHIEMYEQTQLAEDFAEGFIEDEMEAGVAGLKAWDELSEFDKEEQALFVRETNIIRDEIRDLKKANDFDQPYEERWRLQDEKKTSSYQSSR